MEDRELITAIKRGEIELFKVLVERYQNSLLGFIHSITRNRLLTEDVGQEVFLSFFRSLDRFDETMHTSVAAWLFTVARNLAINALKRERRYVAAHTPSEELSDNRPGPPDLLIHRENRAILAQCLLRVPEPYRTTLMESLRGRSIEEIASQKMVVPGTVKSRLVRAREKIIALFRAELKR